MELSRSIVKAELQSLKMEPLACTESLHDIMRSHSDSSALFAAATQQGLDQVGFSLQEESGVRRETSLHVNGTLFSLPLSRQKTCCCTRALKAPPNEQSIWSVLPSRFGATNISEGSA